MVKREIKDINTDKLMNLKNSVGQNELAQAALTAISVNLAPDEIKELKELFLALDVNGDGTLSLQEIEEGLKGKSNKKQIMEMIQSADTDGSGDINYTEFIAAMIGSHIYTNEAYLR